MLSRVQDREMQHATTAGLVTWRRREMISESFYTQIEVNWSSPVSQTDQRVVTRAGYLARFLCGEGNRGNRLYICKLLLTHGWAS